MSLIYPVAPEGLDLRIRHHDAAEINQERSDDDGVCERSEVGIRTVCGNRLSDRCVEELIKDHLQVHLPRRTGLNWKSGRKVPAHEEQRGANNEHRDLGDDLRRDECKPVVGLALLLSRFEDVSVLDEQWLELVDAAGRNEHEVEDRHHTELEIVCTVAELPECETGEETVGDVDSDLVPDVVGVAPQCD
jgi:hypothetical protein